MLKFIFMIFMLFFFSFMKSKFWLVQNFLFMIIFLFMINLNLKFYYTSISYFLGMDILSYGLILLSFWVISLMLMASEKIYKLKNNYNLFIVMILFLLLFLILTFSVMNLFLFYLFFESSLIPTFFLILGWGYQPERLQAGFYLLFYTLLASLPLLLGIFYCKNLLGSIDFFMLKNIFYADLLYFCMMMAFLVKMPMFFVHLWLPKAHVEAPVAGSMILAGVLLKLGGYGFLRSLVIIQSMALKFNLIWYIISLLGGILISLVCLFQVDLKSLIAYSSVAHMSLVIAGSMTMSYWGFIGSYVLMLGHGLCSSGLFCLSNIIYERFQSRSLFINKGLMNFMPSMSFWWFLLCSSNMAAPPSLNLLGEIMLINSILSWSFMSMLLLSLASFFSASYSLYLFAYTQHGKVYNLNLSFMINNFREYMMMFLHWFPLNFLILKPDNFSLWI